MRDGEDLIRAGTITGSGKKVHLQNIDIYDRHGNRLVSVITAKTGYYTGKDWRAGESPHLRRDAGHQPRGAAITVGKVYSPGSVHLVLGSSRTASPSPSWTRRFNTLRESGRPVASLEGALWHKITGPLSALLMPLLGSVAAFGIARSGKLFVRAVIGMALGFAFFVADNFALSMGNLGVYPPLLAAWAPFLLFLLVGEAGVDHDGGIGASSSLQARFFGGVGVNPTRIVLRAMRATSTSRPA